MPRFKPSVTIIKINSLEEADSTLAQIAECRRHLGLIQNGLNEDIDKLKLQAEGSAEPIRQELAMLERGLASFAADNKADLFKQRKSITLSFGTLGFRQTSKLKPLPKSTFNKILSALQERGLKQYIRTKLEVDREALKEAPPETIMEVGAYIEVSDDFFYATDEHSLSPVGGEAA